MQAHDLAQLLLDGPNIDVVIMPVPSVTWISDIVVIRDANYMPFGDTTRHSAIVLVASEESLNDDADLEWEDDLIDDAVLE